MAQEQNCTRCHKYPCHDECDLDEKISYNKTLKSEDKILSFNKNEHASKISIADAVLNLKKIKKIVLDNRFPWVEPHISLSPEGEILFEWWKGNKKITLYFSEDGIDGYLIPPTGNISNVVFDDLSNVKSVFAWLLTYR